MKLTCSAVIPDEAERRTLFKEFVQRFGTSYSEQYDTLYMEYAGDSQSIVDAIIQTFERYEDHSIVYSS